ncbi:P-loop containing nucleoside triphosphate hydrolase protein [Schizophyllum commune Loenen D]|nr:P-loop containing nucleoside triphosphate hydrolase protein [Schizophyllum commune Loenen D]
MPVAQVTAPSGYMEYSYASISQVVLDGWALTVQAVVKPSVWTDPRIIPAYVALASAVLLVLHAIVASRPAQRMWARLRNVEFEEPVEEPLTVQPASFWSEFKLHVASHGGWTIYAFKVARLIGTLVLLGLSIASFFIDEARRVGTTDLEDEVDVLGKGKWGKKHKHRKQHAHFTKREWLELAMSMTYLYTVLLALITVAAKPHVSKIATRPLCVILFVAFCVYFYRDIVPFFMPGEKPSDRVEGPILWAKIVVSTITAVVIPLFVPHQYEPVEPENPLPPSDEQTASWISFATYAFLDPIIKKALKVNHLTPDDFPPLCDYDRSQYLRKKAFKLVDTFSGAPKRHLFFNLMSLFRYEYVFMGSMIILNVLLGFASPVAINRLLDYLETRAYKQPTFEPWFWITWLFLGPSLMAIAIQGYIFVATRMLVRTEAIITQLVFEHALRIRMKAETPNSTPTVSKAPTPDNGSVADQPAGSESSGDETLHSASPTETTTTTTAVGGAKAKKGKGDKEEEGHSSSEALVGKINNLVTTDLNNLVDGRDFLFIILYIPLQIALCIVFLYKILGWSSLVGLAVIIALFPVPGYVAKKIQDVQVARLKRTDARVQTVTETMNVLRMIKLFGWEWKMSERVGAKREEELKWIWKRQMLDMVNGNLNFVIPIFTMMATYITHTAIMGEPLSASKVFSSITVFDMLRDQLHTIFGMIGLTVSAKVSLDRVNDFLKNTELLDEYSGKDSPMEFFAQDEGVSMEEIGFRNAAFTWSEDAAGSLTPSKRNFMLKIEDELLFRRGGINLIIGPTGSGKTSLLMALLGEMHFVPSAPDSWFHLPRSGGVAYAAQESWVQNETIRDNIVFGSPFDEERYKKVLYQCGLERDLTLFEAGDQTEVGEKGLTLSGGQKARVTLARAVYSNAQILLLDDVLAALDVHTAKWIVDKCFCGDLIKGRTVLLVTHNVASTRNIANFVVSLGVDGRIAAQGTVQEVLAHEPELAVEAEKEEADIKKVEDIEGQPEVPPAEEEAKSDGKLIVAEEVEEGHISWKALKLYLAGLGGNHPMLFFIACIGGILITESFGAFETWYLGYWAGKYEEAADPRDVNVFSYATIYACMLLTGVAVYCVVFIIYTYGSIRASRTIHKQLVDSVLGTTLRWLDTTPTSRVIARCTQDIRSVDGPIAQNLFWLLDMTMSMSVKFVAVVIFSPLFLVPGVAIAALGGYCGEMYIKAQLSVKREMSNARAPVLAHFGAAIAGLTSIRAYGVQSRALSESMERVNRYVRAARAFYNLNRWICIRIDALGGLFAALLAGYLVYFQDQKSSTTGFSLNMAVGFSGMILWWVRILNQFEVEGNSLERIQGYVTIEQEKKPSSDGVPPAYWPASGELKVEKLAARYSADGPKVLHDISFHINSGERIGVVGRTGSGKSSLTLSLLRCIFTEGEVYYDGLLTSGLNLDALRSSITIIPQVPELLSGTLRQNLDPFDQYDDATLNDALRSAGLFALQSEMDEGRITLDSAISSGGSNLSVGQRQILALARAIVRGSKLLILDEATSAIDYKTDNIIQTSLREQLKGDVTLITIAHRLQTIMDADKIMVLDAGRIVEFDKPSELLKKQDGRLKSLVDESGDKARLYAIAEGRERV